MNNRKEEEEELEVIGQLLANHPNDYLIWRQRRGMIENIGREAVRDELEFTNKILLAKPAVSTYNIQAWSHREWIIQKFDTNLWLPEIRYCREILDRDIFNVSAWEQICRAVKLYPHMTKELRDVEVAYAKRVIYEQPGNEGPWTYLTFLYMKHLRSLYTNPNLECVYVDFLAEEADRIKFISAELDPLPGYSWRSCKYTSVDIRGCLNALSLVASLMAVGYEARLNTRLVEAVDFLVKRYGGIYSHKPFVEGSEFSRKVGALALSLGAPLIRYRKRCLGYVYRWYEGSQIIYDSDDSDDEEDFNINIFDTDEEEEEEDDEHQNSLRIEMNEQFQSWLKSNDFGGLPMEWKERLSSTYLKKRTEYNRNENDALEDLKWIARRVRVKLSGSNNVALDEVKFTTDIINNNAYNHRAWSHRKWVFYVFGEDWESKAELQFCGDIIEKNPYNTFAWDQRYSMITRILPKIHVEQSRWRMNEDLLPKYRDYYEERRLEELLEKFRDCYDERRCEERDFALKFIIANPENHLPWGHISGLYTTNICSAEHYFDNMSLLNAILHVLEKARDCRRLDIDNEDEDKGSVMRLSWGSSASVNNARAVVNAISMLSEFTNDRRNSLLEDENVKADSKRFKAVLDELCPDSTIEFKFYWLKMCAIVGAMEKASTDCGRFVRHPIDELLTPRRY